MKDVNNDETIYEHDLVEGNCHYCGTQTTIPFEVCHTCALDYLHLQVRQSTIENAGLGVFAYNPHVDNDAIIFTKKAKILEYVGENITTQEVNTRYRDLTAPYAVRVNRDTAIDSTLARGLASLINTGGLTLEENNCELSYATRTRKMNIKATKNIRNNQELFCYYGDDYHFDSVHTTFPVQQQEQMVIDLTNDNDNDHHVHGNNILGFVDLTEDD